MGRAFRVSGGKLDAKDGRYGEFGVWRDADGDGAVDEGETATLAQVGIASINLTGTAVDGSTNFGEVAVLAKGTYTLANGTTRDFADAALTYYSAAANLPEIADINYRFGKKSNKYFLNVGGGAISVVPRGNGKGIDPLANQLGASTILTFKNATYGMFAAVVLDLDGNGIDLQLAKKSQALFDYNGDGRGNDTAWVGRQDGFLVIDRNNDGRITEQSELDLSLEAEGARSGLEGLTALDSNRDGVVDAEDARFGELKIWQDANGNGVTDSGELKALTEGGITAIRLNRRALNNQIGLGSSAVFATASFVRDNGTTATVADTMLSYSVDGARVSAASRSLDDVSTYHDENLAPSSEYSIAELRDMHGVISPRWSEIGIGDFAFSLRQATTVRAVAAMSVSSISTPTVDFSRVDTWASSAVALSNGDQVDWSSVSEIADQLRRTLDLPLDQAAVIERSDPSRSSEDLPIIRAQLDPTDLAYPDLLEPSELSVRLALLRQDMAAFGAGGADSLGLERRTVGLTLDWFA